MLIPRDRWPDETCNEHAGEGWEVKIVERKGRWSKCKFINATHPDGRRYADEWRPHDELIKVTVQRKDNESGSGPEVGTDVGNQPIRRARPPEPIPLEPLVNKLLPSPGDTGPTPNFNTLPPEPGADPLREPARPARARVAPERFTVGSIAACHIEIAAAMATSDSSLDQLLDVGGLAKRLSDRVVAAVAIGEGDNEYYAFLNTSLASMDIRAQTAACLMADYDDIADELGASSDQARLARELYAAAVFSGVQHGVLLPPLDPLLSAVVGPREPGGGCSVSADVSSFEGIYDPKYDGWLLVSPYDTINADVAFAAKKNTSPNIFTERQMTGPRWDEPKQVEMSKMDRLGARTPVVADDPLIKGKRVVDTMWAGRCKLHPDGTVEKDTARCVLRGDLHSKFYQVDANKCMSPVVRNSSMMCVDAVGALYHWHMQPYDVTGAYLHGKQLPSEQVVARPPVGFREYDERGVEILWLMWVPLYGQCDAGAIWNRTVNDFQTSPEMGYERCPHEPCVYSKPVDDGSQTVMTLYVDDGRYYFGDTRQAKQVAADDRAKFGKAFEVRYGDEDPLEDWFLGANRVSPSLGACSVRCTSYIDQLVKRYADGDVSPCRRFPASWSYTPADGTLTKEYEAALATRTPASAKLTHDYMSLFGSLLHAVKYRPDIAYPLQPLGSCLTFPTEGLYNCLLRVLVYLGRTRLIGTSFTDQGNGSLHAFADSNWSTTRSITGYVIFLGGGAVAHASRRQHCITMSSCEAELVALADLSIELLYIDGLALFIGYKREGPIDVSTDNKGAYDQCHRFTSAANSRHVDRKLFKMRELRGAGLVKVRHVPTESNPADMFTKVLTRQPFEKHRRTVLNTAGGDAVEMLRRKRETVGDAPYATVSSAAREAKEVAKIKCMVAAAKPVVSPAQVPPEFWGMAWDSF